MAGAVVVAVDGGGTRTRVLVCGTDGGYLSFAEGAGCNPERMPVEACVEHAREAIGRALEAAARTGSDVRAFVAGIAGRTAPGDAGAWTQGIAPACGIGCPGEIVGDEEIAQHGALAGAPGIVYIAGTGSIVFGRTASGRGVTNFDFGHYADLAPASWLAREAALRIAAREAGPDDRPWVAEFLAILGVPDMAGLRAALLTGEPELPFAVAASSVTAAALQACPLPQAVCARAADNLVRGVRLLVPEFTDRPVAVAPAGSVACSAHMRAVVSDLLSRTPDCRFEDPRHPPVVGAAMLALRPFGLLPGDAVFARLGDSVPQT